jgi:2-iminobutanoate/2-iminopropanoate deaminase
MTLPFDATLPFSNPLPGRSLVFTPTAPTPVGPYSQAIVAQGLVFTAGQIALDPQTGEVVGTDVTTQSTQVLKNLSAVLAAAGTSLNNVVKTTVYLASMDDFTAMNQVYSQFFSSDPAPARSTVEVSRLPKNVLVEIEVIAWKPGA